MSAAAVSLLSLIQIWLNWNQVVVGDPRVLQPSTSMPRLKPMVEITFGLLQKTSVVDVVLP